MFHAGNINWTYTLGVGVLDPFACGATGAIYAGEREPGIWPALIEKTGVTIFAAVPSLYRQILKYGDPSARDLSRLRHGVTAGEALSPELLAHWRQATGLWLYEALGMSEISTYVSSRPGETIRPGSPGRPQTGRRVAVLPIEGGTKPLPPGEDEPAGRPPQRSRPHARLLEPTGRRGGRLPGGMVHRRRPRRVRRRRLRVAPGPQRRHHERLRLPGVATRGREGLGVSSVEGAVAERKVAEGVSVIAAFVVAKPGSAPDEAALLAHCAEHLAAYKRPRKIVFVSEIAHTANGKVSRRMLPQVV